MRTRVDAVVIGGGVTGVSVLYHLARMGMANCMARSRDRVKLPSAVW